MRVVFTEEVACDLKAHLSLEDKCFSAHIIDSCSLVSSWEWSNKRLVLPVVGAGVAMLLTVMMECLIYPAFWQGVQALDP